MGLVERLIMAFVLPWRVLFSGALAAKLKAAEQAQLPPADVSTRAPTQDAAPTAIDEEAQAALKSEALEQGMRKGREAGEAAGRKAGLKDGGARGALTVMSLLQREGRLIDFLMEDVTSFSDAEVGAAARAVHEGCKKVCTQNFAVKALRTEEEESRITVDKGFDNQAIRLVGNVTGDAPYSGTLIHAGWRADKLSLPERSDGGDDHILAPAEVEL